MANLSPRKKAENIINMSILVISLSHVKSATRHLNIPALCTVTDLFIQGNNPSSVIFAMRDSVGKISYRLITGNIQEKNLMNAKCVDIGSD